MYLVGNEVLEPLKRELRDTAVFAFDPSKVTTITITGWSSQQGRESLTFDQKDGTWVAKVPPTYRVDPAKERCSSSKDCRGSASSDSSRRGRD